MRVYRRCWLTAAGALAALGVGAAVALVAPLLLATLVLLAVVSASTGVLVGTAREDHGPPTRGRRVGAAGVLAGSAAAATIGYAALLGPGAVLIAVLLTGLSPGALRAWRRWLARLPHPTEAQLEGLGRALAWAHPTFVPFDPSLGEQLLSDEELARAWRDSRASVRVGKAGSLARAVEQRGCYLRELERRHPALLRAWLDGEVGAPDDWDVPASSRAPAVIDWDQLTGGQATDR